MRASTSVHRLAVALASLAGLAGACAPRPTGTPWAHVEEVTPGFLVASTAADPSLAVDRGGRVALTWVTRDTAGAGADAWASVSADSGGHWSEPVRLNPLPGTVSSFSESRPVAAWGRDGLLVAAWAAKRSRAQGTGDDMAARVSIDGGRSWGTLHIVNDDHVDPTSGYHGFAAADVLPDGRPIVAWIDGRSSAGLADEPELAEIYASTSADGGVTWSPDIWIAADVCACCRIAMRSAQRLNGAIDVAVAYRGATNGLRDPRVVVSRDAARRFVLDTLISVDRWKLPGCPSVGSAMTLENGGGHYFWYTGESPADSLLPGRPLPGLYLVPWRVEVGAAGPKRDIGDSLGNASRPMLASLGRGTLLGAIGESPGAVGRKVLALRRLEPDGSLTPWLFLGSGVKSGTIAARVEQGAWAAWTEPGDGGPRVRVAKLSVR
jgi:hypothetical protein